MQWLTLLRLSGFDFFFSLWTNGISSFTGSLNTKSNFILIFFWWWIYKTCYSNQIIQLLSFKKNLSNKRFKFIIFWIQWRDCKKSQKSYLFPHPDFFRSKPKKKKNFFPHLFFFQSLQIHQKLQIKRRISFHRNIITVWLSLK